ncbi:MAG: putative lipid II flippase FtsW [Kiritimatiellae bacterium]|nr:putative lipid II flippase FtsW [Kiritimatiellia bacterium]
MRKTASVLLGSVLILLTLGVVMLASTSSIRAESVFGDPLFYVKKQVLWLVVSAVACVVVSRVDYHIWRKLALPFSVLCVILLVMTLIPNVGVIVNGSRRWLRFGVMNFQPSELAKPTVILLLAWWMAHIRWHVKEFKQGMLFPISALGVVLLLIFAEPDYGTTMLIAVVGMLIMFTAGTRFIYLFVAGLLGASAFTFAIMYNEVRMRRIIAFLNPEKYAQEEAFQLLNAVYAFVVGGGSGVGLGQSMQKRFYLPEAHTDFIFAIMAEELGLTVSIAVVLLFVTIFLCGLRVAMRAPDEFGRLTAFGISTMITVQAAINIGVVTGCLPTKGLPLPFISFGGSSLLVTMGMVGILLNICSQTLDEKDIEMNAIGDKRHRF